MNKIITLDNIPSTARGNLIINAIEIIILMVENLAGSEE